MNQFNGNLSVNVVEVKKGKTKNNKIDDDVTIVSKVIPSKTNKLLTTEVKPEKKEGKVMKI
jgi:hypothetical protein